MFEIYERTEGRKKTYIVYRGDYVLELRNYAKRYFKSSADKIILKAGWVLNDELYLEYLHDRRA